MAFDGLVCRAVVLELADRIQYGKIEKIYQPETDELVFHIHTKSGKLKLYSSCNPSHARIHLSQADVENPASPHSFCMLLRKHFSGGRILGVSQRETERIIEIDVETMNELGFSVNKKLVFEIMGKHSNIIAVDKTSGRIIDCIKRVSIDVNRVRQLLPGKQYEYPPSQRKLPLDKVHATSLSFTGILDENTLAKAILGNVQGFSPAAAAEIACSALTAQKESRKKETFKEAEEDISPFVYEKLAAVGEMLSEPYRIKPSVYLDENNLPVEFHVLPLSAFENYYRHLRFDSVSEAAEYFYAHKNSSNRIKQKSNDLSRALTNTLNKFYLKKQRLSEDLLQAENSEKYRLYGELLTANLHLVTPGCQTVTVNNYYTGEPLVIPLDTRYTAAKNAQNYFKKYGKSKTAVKEKKLQLEEVDNDIKYLESVSAFADNASSVEETEALRDELVENGYLRRRKNTFQTARNKSVPCEYHTADGYRVLVGRNNKENDLLTFKTAGSKDLWFHTKDIPGSHVILFTKGIPLEELPKQTILEAAALAAYYSKGRSSENVPVDYVPVRFVKKPSGAKPGMVIFTNNRTVYVDPALPETKK